MKNLIFYLGLAVTLSSCVDVNFEQPQPRDTKSQDKFPKSLQGVYITEDSDTLTVTELTYRYGSEGESFFSNMSGQLSDELILKRHDDLYFLNYKDEDLWDVMLISLKGKDRLTVSMIAVDEEKPQRIEKLKKITTVKEVYDDSGEIESYIIDPTRKELDKMVKENVFSELEKFKRTED